MSWAFFCPKWPLSEIPVERGSCAKEVGYRFTRLVLVQCAVFQWRRVANSDRSDPAGVVRGGEPSGASAVVRSANHSHPAEQLKQFKQFFGEDLSSVENDFL